MKEWLYQVFLKTGSVEAYLLLKELSREASEVTNNNGIPNDGRGCNYQGVQPW